MTEDGGRDDASERDDAVGAGESDGSGTDAGGRDGGGTGAGGSEAADGNEGEAADTGRADAAGGDRPDAGGGGRGGADDTTGGASGGAPGTGRATDDERGTPDPDEQYCASCGEVIKRRAEICPHCGVRNRSGGGGRASKDRATAGILAILLGSIGAHKFYLGDTGLGVLYLCFFWTGVPAILGLIEGLLYLTKTDEEFQRQYVEG